MKSKLKFVKFKDLLSMLLLAIILIPALITKIFVRDFWLVCEEKNEARDNGYHFFKHVRKNHPKQKIAYAINKKSPDYNKVKGLGKVVSYGTISHWFWYIVADKNISSQKGGKPNPAVCYLFEVVFKMRKNNRIFLQHGVIINDLDFLHFKNTNMRMFVTTTTPETEFVKSHFGYPAGYINQTGLARFDNLNNFNVDESKILVMPTWRQWLSKGVEAKDIEGSEVFKESNYYKYWSEFINSEKLDKCLKKYNKKLMFYPHRNMQKFLNDFSTKSSNIEICSWQNNDIQDVLKECAVMITDYSSVFFDFLYMKKPVLFYQFDEEMFRKYQYGEGYFSYKNNGMTQWANNLDDLLHNLELTLKNNNNLISEEAYSKYFKYSDTNNCERIYEAIKGLKNHGKNKSAN